jgi:hypothetical protein
MREIVIQNRLEVLGTDRLMLPGCEPESTVTSTTLLRWRNCPGATVLLADALAAIPGSRLEYQINGGKSNGGRRRWFVLPEFNPDCPCQEHPDYYAILRSLATSTPEQQPDLSCAVNDQGFCPDRNLAQIPPAITAADVYKEEGSLFGMTPQLFNRPHLWGGEETLPDLPITF